MKILVLSVHTPSLFWFRMNMMQTFLENGHSVVAVGSEPEDVWAEKFEGKGIEYRQIPVSRNGMNPLEDLKTQRAMEMLFREIHPDKIFAYQAKAIVYGAVAAKKCGISEFYALIAGLGSIFRGSGFKNSLVRSVLTVQYKIACNFSRAVLFQNEDDRSEFVNRGIVNREKTRIIHGSGVDIHYFAEMPLPQSPGFLFVGRLIKDKGVREYLEACRILKRECPDALCMLVGPFDSNPSALSPEELDEFTKDGTVAYYGEQEDVRPYLQRTSVFVLPSYHEGTPKSVLEAMAVGRAIVTTDAPGCRETVTNGVNGFLVEPKNANAVAEAMLRLANDPTLCRTFGQNSRKIAVEKYDVDKVNASIMEIMSIKRERAKTYGTV